MQIRAKLRERIKNYRNFLSVRIIPIKCVDALGTNASMKISDAEISYDNAIIKNCCANNHSAH